jgi:glycosyltransferase involved in cell wall biosynthesis
MIIGIDITSLPGGRGPARYTTEIIRAMAKCPTSDDRFFLYSPFHKTILNLPDNFIQRVIPIKKTVPWLNWSLPRQIKRDKIEVMLFPANDFWLWPHTKTIVTILDVAQGTVLKDYKTRVSDRIQSFMQRKVISFTCESLITISDYSAGQITEHFKLKNKKPTVIHCGVSEIFKPSTNTAVKKDYILFVGGFDRRKNLERLLQAYKIIKHNKASEKLILAGSGGANKRLYYDIEELVKDAGLTEYVEIIKDPAETKLVELYNNAKLLVMPSLIEGFGLPVLEAMACGCPVACSNAASLPEVGGDAALYFDPYDVNEMAAVMNKMLNDDRLRKELTAQGLARAKKFSWDVAGRQVYAVIKNIK